MALEVLQIGLIVSISGIVAISLFTLYLLDKLEGRVRFIETAWKEYGSRETHTTTMESKITYQTLEDIQRKIEQTHQSLKDQVEAVAVKTDSLREELAGLNQNIVALSDSTSDDKVTAESLREEISSIERKYDEMEKLLTEIVRKLLQSRA